MNVRFSRRRLLLGGSACVGASCLPSARFKHRHTTVPEALDDGWSIGSPGDVGLDPGALEAIHEELLREDRQRGALGMLVVKQGQLVWETYLRTTRDRDLHHHVQSVTKSVTNLAFGVARDQGHFPSLELRLQDLIPEELTGRASNKSEITLEHLLTMRSGIDFDNDVFSTEMWIDRPAQPLHYMLAKPLYAAPGERFYYRDVDPQILGYLLQQETGESEESWARRHILAPLGIHDYLWEEGPGGVSMAAHGLHLRARDMAKLGQLMLEEGSFEGQRVVSSEWTTLSAQTHVEASEGGTGNPRLGYGYYWWTVHGQDVYSAWGHGGQHILVSPRDQLVVVKIALPDTDDLEGGSLEDLLDLIAPLLG
jgi:CubicO group peptidase (beta-lactamase class C family)